MVGVFILPKALPTSRSASAFRSIEQHPAGCKKPRVFLNQAQEGKEPGNGCSWPPSVLETVSWMFQTRSWKG